MVVGSVGSELCVCRGWVYGPILWLFAALCGCSFQQSILPGDPAYQQLTRHYHETTLKETSEWDVLRALEAAQGMVGNEGRRTELVSRGDRVIATSGLGRNGYRRWFTLFVFDERARTAQRKYFFYLDERVGALPNGVHLGLALPRRNLVFEGSLVLSHDFGGEARSAAARDTALLRYIASRVRLDCQKVDAGMNPTRSRENTVSVSGLLMNQVFRAVLLELERSPSLAAALSTPDGMAFEHLTLDRGRAHVTVQGDVAVVRLEVGLPSDNPKPSDGVVALVKSLL